MIIYYKEKNNFPFIIKKTQDALKYVFEISIQLYCSTMTSMIRQYFLLWLSLANCSNFWHVNWYHHETGKHFCMWSCKACDGDIQNNMLSCGIWKKIISASHKLVATFPTSDTISWVMNSISPSNPIWIHVVLLKLPQFNFDSKFCIMCFLYILTINSTFEKI